uniref:Flavin-containing monooxygenase n=1 Tax=Oryza punctata TaxID=4537 RepID=A0A0E0JGK7_ORYPU
MAEVVDVDEHEEEVIVVGAGVSGLATAACLSVRGVASCLVLERDCCVGSLWRRRAYDRLRLHLPKQYLVAAAGENDERVFPDVPGMETFPGKTMHAADYRNAEGLKRKSSVLVVGCGNSGMEIAYDLADSGAAATSIVVRGEVHLMTRWIMRLTMSPLLVRHLPLWAIDKVALLLCHLVFGDTSRYGLRRPAVGPFSMRLQRPDIFPVLDVGTFSKIRAGEIRVLPAITRIHGSDVEFADGTRHAGSRQASTLYIKSDDGLIGDDGMAARRPPNHWNGENGLYCAGMNRRGIYGAGVDAELIAGDISRQRGSDSKAVS